ncbi:MAG: hypothetical protein KAG18_03155 [Sinobacterium sp.]|nr:hypothetical protein [Sinobacterium sp.]
MTTKSTDLLFEPKVWSDHVQAFFDEQLVYGAFALRNFDLVGEGKGVVVNFPYYKMIGDAEELAEDDDLTVDKLSDDSFSCTIFEVGKAVGIKKKAFKVTADSKGGMLDEAQRQMALKHAIKVDAKLNDEINKSTSHTIGYSAVVKADVMTVRKFLIAKVVAFGDKSGMAVICFMHSHQFLDLTLDPAAKFLERDGTDPLNGINGFKGRLAIDNCAIVVVDSVKMVREIDDAGTPIKVYRAHFHKPNSYGIMEKQDIEFDNDKDILAREIIVTSNQWYGVKSFHMTQDVNQKLTGAIETTTSLNL